MFKNFTNKLSKIEEFKSSQLLWLFVFSIILRLIVTLPGYNYDLESWVIVGQNVAEGKIVYAETFRYTTGPIWCYVLGMLYKIHDIMGLSNITTYHLFVAFFLSLVDIATAYLLIKTTKPIYGLIVLFNPASILISGYHTQFDNFAIFFALASWIITYQSKSDSRNHIIAAFLIGLSLVTKHILVFYPIWLFLSYKNINLKYRIIYLVIPFIIFLGSFLPFFLDENAKAGIINNVFNYESQLGTGFFGLILSLIPDFIYNNLLNHIPVFSGMKFFFMLGMIFTGYWVSTKKYYHLFPFYLISMLVFTPSIADQYFVIPIIAVALFIKHTEMKIYLIMLSVYLLFISPNNIASVISPFIINTLNDLISLYSNIDTNFLSFASLEAIPDSVSNVKINYSSSELLTTIKNFGKQILFYISPLIQLNLVIYYIRYIIGNISVK